MAGPETFNPAVLKPSMKTSGGDLKPSLVTANYSGGTPGAGDLKPPLLKANGDLKESLLQNGVLKPSIAIAVPPLLDGQSGITNAYSLRKLLSSYSGSAIRVERDSDSTQQDIGFTASGDLDTASLLSFVGAGNGYVRTWYDQAGSIDITSTSAQIVISGSVVTDGSRPSMESNYLAFDSTSIAITFASVLIATEDNVPTTANAGDFIRVVKSGVGNGFTLRRDGADGLYILNHTGTALRTFSQAGAWTAGTGYHNLMLYKNFTSTGGLQEVYAEGAKVLEFAGDSRISASFSGNNTIGNVREIVFFSEDKRSELSSLNANMQAYYG